VAEFLRADDAELLPYDCEATLVHARRLHDAGLLSDEELREVGARLSAVREEGAAFVAGDEDIHSTLERLLGPVGRKVHAGRSRNDQVAAAFRLYVADACAEAHDGIASLASAVLDLAEREADTLFPGYTHLQRAQPVTLGHHLLAWTAMLERDLVRFAHAAEQAGPSPLGAGALAGSTLPLAAPPGVQATNSLDAVADRDFALDYLYACAVLLGHLSRIGEEIVLWSAAEFGLVRLPESAATGSSMMPQKLNPDVAELVRGKAGTAAGRLSGLLAVVKGLPLAYNRDLQEDKPPVFAARGDVRGALAALAVLVDGLEVDHERAAEAVSDPALLATDAAEQLVRRGVSFRDAYEEVAEAVREGRFEPPHDAEDSVAARGAPGPGGVAEALAAARARFDNT
jgi:argininosuccinate lyase